jgi:hypothetical protein
MTKREPRTVHFEEIERNFMLRPMTAFNPPLPPVVKSATGWRIRVLTSMSYNSVGEVTENYDYFEVDVDGSILSAPRGHAKEFRPGRIPLPELLAAQTKYATTRGSTR